LVDVANKTEYKVSVDEEGYFYHMGILRDVDGDGLLDILTAKTNFPFFGTASPKMVWFKNPGSFLLACFFGLTPSFYSFYLLACS